jgi:hypothetical protein
MSDMKHTAEYFADLSARVHDEMESAKAVSDCRAELAYTCTAAIMAIEERDAEIERLRDEKEEAIAVWKGPCVKAEHNLNWSRNECERLKDALKNSDARIAELEAQLAERDAASEPASTPDNLDLGDLANIPFPTPVKREGSMLIDAAGEQHEHLGVIAEIINSYGRLRSRYRKVAAANMDLKQQCTPEVSGGSWDASLPAIVQCARSIVAHYEGEAWKWPNDSFEQRVNEVAKMIASAQDSPISHLPEVSGDWREHPAVVAMDSFFTLSAPVSQDTWNRLLDALPAIIEAEVAKGGHEHGQHEETSHA